MIRLRFVFAVGPALITLVLLGAGLCAASPASEARAPRAPSPASGENRESAGASSGLAHLPLIEVPARGSEDPGLVAVLITGDGGFSGFDKKLSGLLASRGIPVVALSSLKYFRKRREPDQAARDLESILDHYRKAWRKERVVLIGYSMGADVLPFIASRLKPETLARVDTIALLGPAHTVDFKFRFSYWFRPNHDRYPMSVEDEVRKLEGRPVLCVYGEEEKNSICRHADPDHMRIVLFAGGHHFKGHHRAIAELIIANARSSSVK
jgi:type IV secretory pathway VirJ component